MNANTGVITNHEKTKTETVPVTRPSKRWPNILGFILGSILLDFLYCRRMVSGLINPDAMDFAQTARNLLQGRGFVTQMLHPLALTHGSSALQQPDMVHGVLYPFVLALGFGLFGAKDAVVIAISGLFYVLTVPLIYLLGRRLFGIRVGWIAALIFMTNGSILDYAASGTHITLFLFLATCIFYTLHVIAGSVTEAAQRNASEETRKASSLSKPALLMTGILTGLLYLTDPLFIWIVPLVFVAVVQVYPQRRLAALVWFCMPLLALAAPCMLRFGLLTGNPVFGLRGAEVWMGTEIHPGLLGYRLSAEQFASESIQAPSVLRKIFLAAVDAIALIPRMPGSWILLFVAPSLFYRYSNPATTRLRSTLIWSLLAMLAGGLFFSPNPTRLMIVFPALLIFAVAFLQHTLAGARLKPENVWGLCAGMGLVLLSPLAGDLIKARLPATTSEAGVAQALTKQMPVTDLSFSDKPWLVAWYGERASIWMPAQDQTLSDLRQKFPRARWLFLTRETPSLSQEWADTYHGLLQWSQRYHQAQEANAPLPQNVQISGSEIPLLKALDGFQTVPPLGKERPTVVVAQVPATVQKVELP